MAFSEPHYFYNEGDPPDLVDANGPIYARTGVKLSNVTPIAVNSTLIYASNDAMPVPDYGQYYDIVSHDVHVTKTCWSPMPNDDEGAILAVGLSGSITVEVKTTSPSTNNKPIIGLTLRVIFDEFNAGGTVQAPINVYAQVGGDEGLGEFLGTGLLKNPTNVGVYDGTTFGSLVASLSIAALNGHIEPADSVVEIHFF